MNETQIKEIIEVFSITLEGTGPRINLHTVREVIFEDNRKALSPGSMLHIMREMDRINLGLSDPFHCRLIAAKGDDQCILAAVKRLPPPPPPPRVLEPPVPEPPDNPTGALIQFLSDKSWGREVMDWLKKMTTVMVVEEVMNDAMTEDAQTLAIEEEALEGAMAGEGEEEVFEVIGYPL